MTSNRGRFGLLCGLGVMSWRRGSILLLVRKGLTGLLAGCSCGGRGSGRDPWKAGSRETE